MNHFRESIRHRYRRIFQHQDIDLLEFWLGVAFILRGGWVIEYQWLAISIDIQGIIIPYGFTPVPWGFVLVSIGATQVVIAGSRHSFIRALAATFGSLAQGWALTGYWIDDQWWRSAAPLVLTVVLGEMFVAYRSIRTLLLSKSINGDKRRYDRI